MKMLKNNISDSAIKVGIDKWYEKYLSSYSGYLEDTVFCNDRSIHALSVNWNEIFEKLLQMFFTVKNVATID